MRLFKFKELFRVSIKNEYYKNGYSSDFTFMPTKNSIKLLKNHSLKFTTTPQGFALYGEVEQDGSDEKLIRGFQEDTKLTFLMKLKNPYFINFTDIPIKTVPHEVFYINNLSNHETDEELLLINKEEIPKTSSNSTRISLSPEVYKYTYHGSGDDKTATVTFIDDGFSINETVENDKGEYRFQFNIGRYNPGRCEFSMEGESENFYSASEIYRQGVFGIVEIFVKSTVPANYRFVDGTNVVTPRAYAIPFTNRSTIWRYLVYDKLTNKLTKPQIEMSGTEFTLTTTPATKFPEDYTLFTFTSGEEGAPETEKAFPIKEEPVMNITLSGGFNGSRKDIIYHMPNPDITVIKPDINDISKIYSDIILYV